MNTSPEDKEQLQDALMRIRYQNHILNEITSLKSWVEPLIPFGEQAKPHAAELLVHLRTREKLLKDYPEYFKPLGRIAASSCHEELMSFLSERAHAGKPLGVYHLFCVTASAELEPILIRELQRLGTMQYGVSYGLDRGMILRALSDYGSQETLLFLNVLSKDLGLTVQSEWTALKQIMTPAELADLDKILEKKDDYWFEMMLFGPGCGWRGEQLSMFQHISRLNGFHGDVECYGELLKKRLEAEEHPDTDVKGETL